MVKVDLTRDYYGDLELPSTANVEDIKKQFRKLALKYHPDRNPGKETEVNSKFQTIQSAHEVLTNVEQKSKYDAHRARSNRYPAASGVRGNPWQNVSSQYPAPPRRAPTAARPAPTSSSGASRYSGWMPPSPKPARDNNASDNMRAWDRMRPSSSSKPSSSSANQSSPKPRRPRPSEPRPAEPPPPPPRTEAQRKKADAAFGTRRTPFVQVGDEPPVTSKNYFTTKQHTSLFNNASSTTSGATRPRPKSDYIDPLGQQFREAYRDGRQSTPYSSNSGEKTNPFDGANVGRSESVRDSPRGSRGPADGESQSGAPGRQRSSSVPDESDNIKQATRESTAPNPFGGDSKFAFSSRAGERYKPRDDTTKPAPASAPFTNPNSSSSSVNSPHVTVNGDASSKAKGGPTVYASPFIYSASSANSAKHSAHPPHSKRRADEGVKRAEQPGIQALQADDVLARASPSGDQQRARKHLNAFESKQHEILRDLINKRKNSADSRRESPEKSPHDQRHNYNVQHHANPAKPSSFTMPVDDDTFNPTTPKRFMRNSADNINTRFVAEEFADNDWHFQAGGPSEDAFVAAKRQARSRTRNDRQSPARSDHLFRNATSSPKPSDSSQRPNGFNPEQWSATIGPQNFVPQPSQGPSASPTRPARSVKKPKPVRMTAGTAGLVDDEDSSSSEERTRPGSSTEDVGSGTPFATDIPSAMDIDTPPPEPTAPQPSGARGIPVEPSRPEWRAGVPNDAKPAAKPSDPRASLQDNTRGSEDSDGLLHSNVFADFKNVAPFASQPSGLGSLSDLKSDLPFESKASATIPLVKETAKPITFPAPPQAPHPPPALAVPGLKPSAVAWKTYAQSFHTYMNEFADLSARYADHFAARRRLIDQNRKDTGFSWIESRGDAGIREYLRWLEEDKIVRQEWMAVSDAHETRVREFVRCRDKMMQ